MKRYGIPYKGSKNSIARKIVSFLPSADVLIDICAGGCAITHAALEICEGLAPKWERIIANDICEMPLKLFKGAIYGEYADVPQALGIYNHYRKHWLGAFWQLNGINVIPTICWGDESTFDWCFDGEPQNAIVSVSSVGTQRGQGAKAAFMHGYDAMLERLNPSGIIFFGNVPAEARGNIIHVDTFYKRFEQRRGERARNQS